jgi:hypothetical protein
MATLMPLVGAGDGLVDELGSLNEQPDHSAKQIGDYFREALLVKLLDLSSRHRQPTRWPSPGGYFIAGWIGIASTCSVAVIGRGCIV